MKNNVMPKRCISFLLSLVMVVSLLSSFTCIAALEPGSTAYEEYVLSSMKEYIKVFDLDDGADFTMSQPLPISNCDDEYKRVVFCFKNGECVGDLVVTRVDGKFVSSFFQSNFPAVTNAAKENIPIALKTIDKSLMLVSEESSEVILGKETSIPSEALLSAADNYYLQAVSLSEVPLTEMKNRVQAQNYGNRLPLVHVPNEICPDNNEWLCWAASLASIIRYRSNEANIKENVVTATSVYNRVKANFPNQGIPVGNKTWMRFAYETYFTRERSRPIDGSVTYTQVMDIIDNKDRPIWCWINGRDNKGNDIGHFIDICGYTQGYGYYFLMMDPNYGSVSTQTPTMNSTDFTYVSHDGTYTTMVTHLYD